MRMWDFPEQGCDISASLQVFLSHAYSMTYIRTACNTHTFLPLNLCVLPCVCVCVCVCLPAKDALFLELDKYI
jgi:hypothetical protein